MSETPEQIIESALTDLFQLAANRMLHERRRAQAAVPLTRTGLKALARVTDRGPLSVSALAASLEMSMPTASRQLRLLEDLGYVSRHADPADARTVIYEVTAEGRDAERRMRDLRYRELKDALAGWLEEDGRRVAELIRRLVDDMVAASETDTAARRVPRGRNEPTA